MARSLVTRWLCRVYRVLLRAYPADFRRRYGAEMAQVFADRCGEVAQTQGIGGLLRLGLDSGADWLISTIREGMDSMGATSQFAGNGVPVFGTVESSGPSRSALIHGGFLSLAFFSALVFAIGHGGSPRHWVLVGSHHPSRSHLLPVQSTATASTELTTEVQVRPFPDERPISPYFRLLAALAALDANHDGILSASEIANAPSALMKLDKNGDGKLSPEECGLRLPEALNLDPQVLKLAFMRFHPVLAALDGDHDGEISSSEIRAAPQALKTLDRNGDGQLTVDEVLPDPGGQR